MNLGMGVAKGLGAVTGTVAGVSFGSYLIDKPKQWVVGKIGDGFLWVGDKIIDGLGWIGKYIDKGGDVIADELIGVFIIGGMIGVFITMSGNKELGTKVSSISFLVYVAIKILL